MSNDPVEAASLLTLDRVRQMADGQSFARGSEYFRQGRVGAVLEHKGAITATVSGSERYRVTLRIDGEEIDGRCSCPRGDFCKHCVAVALQWLEAAAPANPKKKAPPGVVKLDDLRPWLLQQSSEMLAGLVLDAAATDRRLRERLLRQAAQAGGKKTDVAAYRRAIDTATTLDGDHGEYDDLSELLGGIAEAVDSLRELLEGGHAAEALELSEYAIQRLEDLSGEIDDPNGDCAGILDNLADLHFSAAEKVKPEPVAFAERLFSLEVNGESGTFYGACEAYAALLGQAGQDRYRTLTGEAWARLPAPQPGTFHFSPQRHRLQSLMEHFAGGNLDALIAVKSRDLSQAHTFLEIARLCMDAGRRDEGLAWVERGHRAFPGHARADFTTFLAEEYHRRQRHDEALALIWADFQAHPSLAAYRRLKENAERVTPKSTWPEWRERALALLRKLFIDKKRATKTSSITWRFIDASLLVEIFLWEEDHETAWQTAHASGCSNHLWLQLADAVEATRPADVLPIHQRAAESQIAQKSKGAYVEAVVHLTKVRTIFQRLGREADWLAYLTRLRTEHQRLRSFLALATKL